MKKKIDISTQYTKEENKKNGRKGYLFWRHEKETQMNVRYFGEFLSQHRRCKK